MKQLTKIALRLLSIYFALFSINYLVVNLSLVSGLLSYNNNWLVTILIGPLPFILYLAAAAVLWFKNGELATLVCGNNLGESTGVLDFSDIGRIIYPITGIILISVSIPDISGSIFVFFQQNTFSGTLFSGELSSVQIREIEDIIKGVLQIVVGFILIFAAKRIEEFVKKAVANK